MTRCDANWINAHFRQSRKSSLQSDDKSAEHRSKLKDLYRPTRLGRTFASQPSPRSGPLSFNVSVVVSLDRAGSDVQMQLLHLESALSRMRTVESDLVLPSLSGAEEVPLVRLQLVVIANAPTALLDLLRHHSHWMKVHHSIIWLHSTEEISDYQVVAARQEAWLRQRYPEDDAAAATTEATLNLARESSSTTAARHLIALLEQQRRDPTWSSRFGESTAGYSKVSLPYLVFANSPPLPVNAPIT
jgi:hypothetical protein